MTVNRLVLEWEEKIKLHLEREMKFNQWRSKNFKGKHPTLVGTKEGMDDEEEVTYFSFGRHFDELHVTWAHLEKKRKTLRTNTKTLEDLYSQSLETEFEMSAWNQLRCESLRCHNHDFVEVALEIIQTGEEVAISKMEIVYKLDARALVSKSSPFRF
ncbi:hypothetical protein Tco_1104156 [Tanacetum coccineum]